MPHISTETVTLTLTTPDCIEGYVTKTEVYALGEDATTALYIGETTAQCLKDRLYRHIAKARSGHPSPVHAWIRQLLAKGKMPVINPLPQFRTEQEGIDYLGFNNLLNERNAQHGGAGRPIKNRWPISQDALLGTMSDNDLAEELGRKKSDVVRRRRKLNIAAFSATNN